MKSFHKELWFEIPSRMDFVNITQDVEEVVAARLQKFGIKVTGNF